MFFEKFAEGSLVRKVKCVGYLTDRNFVFFEQSRGMMNDFLTDKNVRCLSGGFLDDACQVFLRNAESMGIEVQPVFPDSMFINQFEKIQGDKVPSADILGSIIGFFQMSVESIAQFQIETAKIKFSHFALVVVILVNENFF